MRDLVDKDQYMDAVPTFNIPVEWNKQNILPQICC
jgi:hypothetical protein